MSPSGKTSSRFLQLTETLFPLKKEEYFLEAPKLKINPGIRQEKLLYYFYYNIQRFYRQTSLFQYLSANVSPGKYFIDIGANLGFYSGLAGQLGYKVITFEPDPMHSSFLEKNPGLYSEFYGVALSESKGSSVFFVGNELNKDSGSLVMTQSEWEDSPYEHTIDVETDRLDNINGVCSKCGEIQLIKVDVEGHEESVVKGFKNLLEKGTGFDVWCEVRGEESNRNPGSYKKVIEFFREYNYFPYIYTNGKQVEFDPSVHVKKVFDILFIKQKKVSDYQSS